jgi:hypothetical protein
MHHKFVAWLITRCVPPAHLLTDFLCISNFVLVKNGGCTVCALGAACDCPFKLFWLSFKLQFAAARCHFRLGCLLCVPRCLVRAQMDPRTFCRVKVLTNDPSVVHCTLKHLCIPPFIVLSLHVHCRHCTRRIPFRSAVSRQQCTTSVNYCKLATIGWAILQCHLNICHGHCDRHNSTHGICNRMPTLNCPMCRLR